MDKRAIITGITGQDGAYLAQLLLEKGYIVFGTYRSKANYWRMRDLDIITHPNLNLIEHNPLDLAATKRFIENIEPIEIYNLAAKSSVSASFDDPIGSITINTLGSAHLLEAIRSGDRSIRYFQASSAEMFGNAIGFPQTEQSLFQPCSPYAVSKLSAHWLTVNYREAYGMFACSGILYNHESPLRGLEFVTRKITDGVAKIKLGLIDHIELGNLDAKRDWGYAKDYVKGMWLMMQAAHADTFILASNSTATVRQFVTYSCRAVDIDIAWQGSELEEKGVDVKTGKVIVSVNKKYYRPIDTQLLMGDASKANKQLGWKPTVNLEQLCHMMVANDLQRNINPSNQNQSILTKVEASTDPK